MPALSIRFYAELNDFLPAQRRFQSSSRDFDSGASIKHVVESMGVAHTEVDLILVNGLPVDFSYQPKDGDQVSVYPVFETFDISPVSSLRPQPLREPRFVLDQHLGKLAVYLRMLGFDVLYSNDAEDEALAQISSREKRILLTRDRGLLKRKIVTHGYSVRADNPRQQTVEVIRRFDLNTLIHPFQRCLDCNGRLEPALKEQIIEHLLPDTRKYFDEFWQCQSCGKVFWKGSHYQHMANLIEEITSRPE